MRAVLVTGGAGYIGSHTAMILAREGFEPVILDRQEGATRHPALAGMPFEHMDLEAAGQLRAIIERHRIYAVIHFAANAYVGESVRAPRMYFRNNVVNTLNLLDAMLDCGVKRVVFSSTCATYGVPTSVPIPESHAQRPVNPYGESKLTVERALAAYAAAYGLHSVALRYFNAAGADPDGQLGEDHDPETHLIPLAIEAALGLRADLEIFGTDYDTPDGTAVRDYVHVMDLASAHVAALRYVTDRQGHSAFNLGTGNPYSVREVIQCVERVGCRVVPTRERPRRDGDPPVLIADARRAREVLRWTPAYQTLDGIVETAWAWHSRSHAAALRARHATEG